MALFRKKQIKNINYKLFFSIPKAIQEDIIGNVTIEMDYVLLNKDLVIDFQTDSSNLISILTNDKYKSYKFVNEHIIIPFKIS